MALEVSFTENGPEVTLQCLQDDMFDVLRRFAQKLFTSFLQDVIGPHDLTLSHPSDCDGHSLARLYALALWVQSHHLQRNSVWQERVSMNILCLIDISVRSSSSYSETSLDNLDTLCLASNRNVFNITKLYDETQDYAILLYFKIGMSAGPCICFF